MTKQRIAFITTRFSTGGAELNALLMAQQFIARGYDAELWSLYRAGNLAHGDVPVRVMLGEAPKSLTKMLKMIGNLRGAIQDFRPDIVHGLQPLANVLTSIAMAGKGRFVASQHNPAESQRATIRWMEGALGSTKLYAGNVAVSHAVADSYSGYSAGYRRKLTVIHNGLPPLTPSDDDKAASRAKLGLPQDVPLIGNIGRLHEQKNPEFLVALMKKLPEVHLMLAGDGPDDAALQAQAANMRDRVHFVGRVADEDVTRAYRALDLFTFPSRYEGFGRAPIEAMHEYRPVLAHDLPITREVIGEHGVLVPLDPNVWSREIRRMLAGPAIDLTAAHEHAVSFSLEAMIDKYLAVLDPDAARQEVSHEWENG